MTAETYDSFGRAGKSGRSNFFDRPEPGIIGRATLGHAAG
jgi:hypothetical protein